MLDQEGNIVDMNDMNRCCANLSMPMSKQSNSRLANMFDKVESSMHEHTKAAHGVSSFVQTMYQEILERELVDRVKNGIGVNSIFAAKNTDFYRVMLARSLANNFTQLLYLPMDYVSYIAFEYDANGMGKALLDDLSTINLMRVALLYSDVLSSIKNSTPKTSVMVNIDDKDPDPLRTGAEVVDIVVKSRAIDLSMLSFDQDSVLSLIQRLGYEFSFEGNDKLPKTKTEINTSMSAIPQSDKDLNDSLKKACAAKIGPPPEMIDNSFNPEFATNSVINNTIFGKKVVDYQNKLSGFLSDLFKKINLADGNLYYSYLKICGDYFDTAYKKDKQEIIDFINEQIPDHGFDLDQESDEKIKDIYCTYCVDDFILNLSVELPRPPSVTTETQSSTVKNYADLVDSVLSAYLDEGFLTPDTQGELSNSIGVYKAIVKSEIMREFISSKGILSEITNIIGIDKAGDVHSSIMDKALEYIELLTKAGLRVKIKTAANAQAADSVINGMGDAGQSSEPAPSTEPSSPNADNPEGGDDGLGGDGLEDDPTKTETAVDGVDDNDPLTEPPAGI